MCVCSGLIKSPDEDLCSEVKTDKEKAIQLDQSCERSWVKGCGIPALSFWSSGTVRDNLWSTGRSERANWWASICPIQTHLGERNSQSDARITERGRERRNKQQGYLKTTSLVKWQMQHVCAHTPTQLDIGTKYRHTFWWLLWLSYFLLQWAAIQEEIYYWRERDRRSFNWKFTTLGKGRRETQSASEEEKRTKGGGEHVLFPWCKSTFSLAVFFATTHSLGLIGRNLNDGGKCGCEKAIKKETAALMKAGNASCTTHS